MTMEQMAPENISTIQDTLKDQGAGYYIGAREAAEMMRREKWNIMEPLDDDLSGHAPEHLSLEAVQSAVTGLRNIFGNTLSKIGENDPDYIFVQKHYEEALHMMNRLNMAEDLPQYREDFEQKLQGFKESRQGGRHAGFHAGIFPSTYVGRHAGGVDVVKALSRSRVL